MEAARSNSKKSPSRNFRSKRKFSPSFLRKSGVSLPISSQPLRQSRQTALARLLAMAGESQRTHRPQFRCASKKLSKNSEADKPLIGAGFVDPGPTYGRR